MSKNILVIVAVAIVGLLSSCGSQKQITYLQNTTPGVSYPINQSSKIVARPGDKLSIVVTCADPQTSALFSLMTSHRSITSAPSSTGGVSGEGSMSDYTVDNAGYITFPILGKVHVGGLNREQISELIHNDLVSKQLVKDPVVVTEFVNLHYSITGEVNSPGTYAITNDRVTILEALAEAGDLTIYGRRDNIKVIREEDGKRTTYLVDMRDDSLFDSPAYYLQQNDVIYVEPNGTRSGQASVNENNWKSVSLWLTLASFVTSIAVLIIK